MSVYILSKMNDNVNYRDYRYIGNAKETQKQNLLPIPANEGVTIRGGAGRPSQRIGFGDRAQDPNGNILWTPAGVVTTITEEQFAYLEGHWLFQKHRKNGYVEVVSHDVVDNHKKVKAIAADMPRDASTVMDKDHLAQKIKVKVPLLEVEE